jgi:hypothetical protein
MYTKSRMQFAAFAALAKLGLPIVELIANFIETSPADAAAIVRGLGGMFIGELASASAPAPAPPADAGHRDTIAPGAAAAVMGLGLDDPSGFVGEKPEAPAPAADLGVKL